MKLQRESKEKDKVVEEVAQSRESTTIAAAGEKEDLKSNNKVLKFDASKS